MRNIQDVNNEVNDVYKVAMAPAFYLSNTFYIFRTVSEQVEIIVNEKQFTSSHFLTSEELDHIRTHYPFLDIINYKVNPIK